jgi:hypothetical protein
MAKGGKVVAIEADVRRKIRSRRHQESHGGARLNALVNNAGLFKDASW